MLTPVEMEFPHYTCGYCELPKKKDINIVDAKFFTDHVLLVKQRNIIISLGKMKKPFKDIKLSNQTKDIKMTETMLYITN